MATAGDQQIFVRAVDGGWCVESSLAGRLMFFSGAQAEAQAATLAKTLAMGGDDVRVIIEDLRRLVVGTRRYFSADEGDTALAPTAS